MIRTCVETALAQLQPFNWRAAVLGVPGLALVPAVALIASDPAHAMIAGGASLSITMGSTRSLGRWRWAAICLAPPAMALAALVGTVAGQDIAAYVLIGAALAAACAGLAVVSDTWWWVLLQATIAFLVSGHFHGPLHDGLVRAQWSLTGGWGQALSIMTLGLLLPQLTQVVAAPPTPPVPIAPVYLLRAGLCVGSAILLIAPLGLVNGYWTPMTAMMVLKPEARLVGTVAGCLVATAYAAPWHGAVAPLLVGIALFGSMAAALQKAHYAGLSASITGAVVLMITLVDHAPLANAEHRVAATMLGGLLALAVASIPVPQRLVSRAGT
jgi:hypothetical protein